MDTWYTILLEFRVHYPQGYSRTRNELHINFSTAVWVYGEHTLYLFKITPRNGHNMHKPLACNTIHAQTICSSITAS